MLITDKAEYTNDVMTARALLLLLLLLLILSIFVSMSYFSVIKLLYSLLQHVLKAKWPSDYPTNDKAPEHVTITGQNS